MNEEIASGDHEFPTLGNIQFDGEHKGVKEDNANKDSKGPNKKGDGKKSEGKPNGESQEKKDTPFSYESNINLSQALEQQAGTDGAQTEGQDGETNQNSNNKKKSDQKSNSDKKQSNNSSTHEIFYGVKVRGTECRRESHTIELPNKF